jgi:hypothetical protein
MVARMTAAEVAAEVAVEIVARMTAAEVAAEVPVEMVARMTAAEVPVEVAAAAERDQDRALANPSSAAPPDEAMPVLVPGAAPGSAEEAGMKAAGVVPVVAGT